MSKDLRIVLLLDCYGDFLTAHQREMMELYYGEDLSLGEIAKLQNVSISRQGVRDAIKRGEQILQAMEEKLHFAQRILTLRENYTSLSVSLTQIAQVDAENEMLQSFCKKAQEQVSEGLKLL